MDTTVYVPLDRTTDGRSTSGSGSAAEPAVRARSLSKVYGAGGSAVHALDAVDVDFAAGAFTAIMGPSGSGKSTLMHLLAGLDSATSGSAFLGSTETTRLGDSELTRLRRDRIGFVFQSFNLLPMFTAEQNILLPLELAGTKVDGGVRAWFDTLVTTLGLSQRLTHRPAELSGGQQQRVAIARALIARPEVVFADEPTGNLDSRSGAEVLSFLRQSVRELGRTIIMVTHDPAAAAYADRVVLLADGRIAGDIVDPTPESVLAGLDALRALDAPVAPADGTGRVTR
ncbi:ABC transporter ATP-binding protein [Cellulomonas sp. ATA003]|uniref:ABC transporter ATP-binding protein n=1 Tax=Cellulomonas sp. ATA003 TaxID=3073064 RepID=UPI00287353CA|nr:ABC transporter ATP-binding protein [Cellulomonas sp. ATA003]WNB86295.1 ABC transporter ATP-binding protein [Cellulomonas sp. ATA003]